MARLALAFLVLALALTPTGSAQVDHHDGECDCAEAAPADDPRRFGALAWAVAGVAAAGGGAGVVTLRRRGRLGALPRWLLLAPLWSRLTPSALTRHPGRARILDVVRDAPGVSTVALAEAARVNEGTLLYHLRTLERAGFVKSLRVGRERVWFEAAGPHPDAERLAALRVPTRRALFDLVSEVPGLAQAELSRRLGCSKGTVHHHLRALEDAGLVEVRRDGPLARCYPASADVN